MQNIAAGARPKPGCEWSNNICPNWDSCILSVLTGDDDTAGDFQAGDQDFPVPSIDMIDPPLALLRIFYDDAYGLMVWDWEPHFRSCNGLYFEKQRLKTFKSNAK